MNYETFKANYLNSTSRTVLYKDGKEFIGVWHNAGIRGAMRI